MLQVTEQGVTITLNGKNQGDGMLWFAAALLVGAVGVVFAMSMLPVHFAIGALFLMVIASFIFNKVRQHHQQRSGQCIHSGKIDVRAGIIKYQDGIKHSQVIVLTSDRINNQGTSLTIYDKHNNEKCHISGFDNAQEVEVMHKVLQGQAFNKRHANIKMKSD